MVRDPHRERGETSSPVNEQPPIMLRQPLDAPPDLGHVGDIDALHKLRHDIRARVRPNNAPRSIRFRARAWAGKVSGRASRRHLRLLSEAVDALAAHSDAIVDRLNLQLDRESDVNGALSEEITRLRADVLHLRSLVADPKQRRE